MAHSALRDDGHVNDGKKVEESSSATTEALTTTCEGETPNSPASDTTSSASGTEEPDLTLSEQGEQVLRQLARQVEYYFSTANLTKDTYVSTLRSLNDGYVPISIIANFGKVRALVPYDSINSVRKAGEDYSDLLEVVLINTQTGKRVKADETNSSDQVNTLEAVGPTSGEPIPTDSLESPATPQPPASPSASTSTSVQNTVILRDVPSDVTEVNVRELFSFDNCPPIKNVHLDVANCWFVVLDTSSRDDMVHVMFSLRSKKYSSGEPVKARLKSGVVMGSDAPSVPPMPTASQMMYLPHMPSSPTHHNRYYNNGGGRKNKKKKNGKNKSNTGGSGTNKGKNGNSRRNNSGAGKGKKNNQERSQHDHSRQSDNVTNTSNNTRANQTLSNQKSKPTTSNVPPLTLGEEQFPALPTDDAMNEPSTAGNKKIEVEKIPQDSPENDFEDMLKKRDHSDAGSTATTSTSSSTSKLGGYAAALLKAAPKQEEIIRPMKKEEKKNVRKTKEAAPETKERKLVTKEAVPVDTPVVVTPPSWGGGRSFADVLKKEEATASLAAEQVA